MLEVWVFLSPFICRGKALLGWEHQVGVLGFGWGHQVGVLDEVYRREQVRTAVWCLLEGPPSRAVWSLHGTSVLCSLCYSLNTQCPGSLKQEWSSTDSVILWPKQVPCEKFQSVFMSFLLCQWTEKMWSRANGGSISHSLKETLIFLPVFVMPLHEGCGYRAWGSLLPEMGQQRQAVGKVLLVPRAGAVTSDIVCAPSSHTWDQHNFLHWFCRPCNPSSEVCCQQGFRGHGVGFSHCCIYSSE